MTISTAEIIEAFLEAGPYAVVGASTDRAKYGNKVLRAYLQRGYPVYAVNPYATTVEGQQSYDDLSALPVKPRGISIITPPSVTEKIMVEAVELGIPFAWMQPGAESEKAIEIATQGGMEIIADGSCFLVAAGYRE